MTQDTLPVVAGGQETSLAAYAANLEAKLQICTMILKSGVAPASFKTPEAILGVMLMGQEYGFSPMKSLELFDFIQGRATIRVAGMLAKAQQAGGRFTLVEETDRKCTIKAERKANGWSETYTFTWEQAEKMKLTGKENWQKMPKFMLYARCASVLVRRGWADIMGGLYSSEEMWDTDVAPVEVQNITVSDVMPDPARMAERKIEAAKAKQPALPADPRVYELEAVMGLYAGMAKEDRKAALAATVAQFGAVYNRQASTITTTSPHPDWAAFEIPGTIPAKPEPVVVPVEEDNFDDVAIPMHKLGTTKNSKRAA